MDGLASITKAGQPRAGDFQRRRIPIEAKQAASRGRSIEQSLGMSPCPKCAIDNQATGANRQPINHFSQQHRDVLG
jgi:hypothetical protein